MANKVKIILDPEEPITFTASVPLPTFDGRKLEIEWTFKHRTREEMGKWIDAQIAAAKAAAEATQEGEGEQTKSIEQLLREQTERETASILDVAVGWNVEGFDFNAENVAKLLNMYPGAANAVLEHYRVSLTQGRVGN